MSRKLEDVSVYPQMDHFLVKSLSDIVFVIDGQQLPANKQMLSSNNTIFRAMFSENFKESKDKEVVIEDTTFEAFKTLIIYIYCQQLVLKDDKDLKLIEDVCKLADRYDEPRLMAAIEGHLKTIRLTFENMESISKIAVNYKLNQLMKTKVKTFIERNFRCFNAKNENQLIAINAFTDNLLFKVFISEYRDNYKSYSESIRFSDWKDYYEEEEECSDEEVEECTECGLTHD